MAKDIEYPVYVVTTFGSMNALAQSAFKRQYRPTLIKSTGRWAFRTAEAAYRFASDCIGYGSITNTAVYECDDAEAVQEADISQIAGRGWRRATVKV